MENKILKQRICKMIAMSYALSEDEVIRAYDLTNSIDTVLESIVNSIVNHTSLQSEIAERKVYKQ